MEVMIPITLFMCITAIAIFRPITKRIGGLLEAMTLERMPARRDARESREDPNAARLAVLIEQVAQRLDTIEERLDFTEHLVSSRRAEPRRPLQRARVEEDELEFISR
ncbi:MAG TPA: hypothetical protein VK928_12945 [Longimicrobiales bacterium]|nr:hypothetical protein [Longimicrobiales bacterium]